MTNDLPAADAASSDPGSAPRPRRITVIGLGKMGGGVARTLARRDDFDVTVHDVSADAVARVVEVGATAATDVVAGVTGADVVITSLPMPADVLRTYGSLAEHLGDDTIAVDTSTIDPATARTAAELVGEHRFVSCLLGKGPAQAEAGELPLFVGGPDGALERLTPVFECIGADTHRLGSVEAATAFKLASNMIGMANLAVLAEGWRVCRQAGVADAAFTEALANTGGWSYQAEVRLPWMIDGDFAARFPTTLAVKDLSIGLQMSTQAGIAAPISAATLTQLVATVAHGHGGEDVNAVVKVVEPSIND